MLINIKMKKICSGSRSQWPFENLRGPKNNLRRPTHLSPFLQNGWVYLAEILYKWDLDADWKQNVHSNDLRVFSKITSAMNLKFHMQHDQTSRLQSSKI